MNNSKGSFLLLLMFLLPACTAANPAPIPTPNPTPLPTATPTPEPIIGIIFWDANGSGLQDNTSFIVPDFDPADLPYFFELLVANGTELGNFSPGELATVPEPPIPAIGVCLGEICTETSAYGTFTLQPEKKQSTYLLKFTNPNADDPAKAFRYINIWNGEVVLESFEINGVTVPTQHLNDTNLIEFQRTISVEKEPIELGLIQGFLTLPYLSKNWDTVFISNFVDLNPEIGFVQNYLGNTRRLNHPNTKGIGTVDQHPGIDFNGDRGDFVVSAANGETGYVGNGNVGVWYPMRLQTNSGHLDSMLVNVGQPSYRGMVIGTNGSTGTWLVHIHFALYDLTKTRNEQPVTVDPFFDTSRGDISIVEFEGSPHGGMNIQLGSIGYWTVNNIPQFPLVEIIE